MWQKNSSIAMLTVFIAACRGATPAPAEPPGSNSSTLQPAVISQSYPSAMTPSPQSVASGSDRAEKAADAADADVRKRTVAADNLTKSKDIAERLVGARTLNYLCYSEGYSACYYYAHYLMAGNGVPVDREQALSLFIRLCRDAPNNWDTMKESVFRLQYSACLDGGNIYYQHFYDTLKCSSTEMKAQLKRAYELFSKACELESEEGKSDRLHSTCGLRDTVSHALSDLCK